MARTYIPAEIVSPQVTTKNALKLALSDQTEFRSLSAFHQHGKLFNLPLVVEAYGPVGIEVTLPRGVAVIEANRHPSGQIGWVVR